jgi:hypothetical protein
MGTLSGSFEAVPHNWFRGRTKVMNLGPWDKQEEEEEGNDEEAAARLPIWQRK